MGRCPSPRDGHLGTNVTVLVGADDEVGIDVGDSAVRLSPRSLTFTPEDWSEPQEVLVVAVDDADGEHGIP